MAGHESRRGGKPLRRTAGDRPERRTVVVFCEGSNTEPDYVKALKKLPEVAQNTALDLRIHPERGMPVSLVKRALELRRDPEIDECWCIFDVEWPKQNPRLREAIEMARSNEIHLAISNPCFELWLILHHKDHHHFIETSHAERVSRKLDGRPGKSIDAAIYMPLRHDAIRRAQNLDKRHEREGTSFPHNNPSSGMYKFLAMLEAE